MIIDYAHSPKRNQDGTIDLIVKFASFESELPFTASPDDIAEYGRILYARAVSGDFGSITPYGG